MPIWNKTDTKPQDLPRAEKRNVIATDLGWVRRQTYTDTHGTVRVKDVLLVAAGGLANSSNMGVPEIDDMWHSATAVTTGTVVNTYISFNEPIKPSKGAKILVANTAGGNTMRAVAATTVRGANNTLLFQWKPSVAGTYKIQAQTVANVSTGAISVVSLNAGGETANLVISGAVSNTAGIVVVS